MSRFFPHSEFSEDQPLAHTILTTHVLARGFQTGTALGLLIGATKDFIKRQPLTKLGLLHSAGVGGAIGTGLISCALAMRMWGREEIEWKDRSWALMKNPGQVRVDDWSQPGALVGLAVVALQKGTTPLGRQRLLGGVGVGSLAGVVGCLAWGRLSGI